MKTPKASVMIPTYNRAGYLGDAIQSVLDQTFTDFELIVVDDESTDDTRKLVNRFEDNRIYYIYQNHRGISAAMNTGIKAARGHYIARLDSDDVWLPEMLAVQVAALDEDPEVGLVYAKAQAMDANGIHIPETRGLPLRYPEDSFKSMLYHDFTCNITVVVRREYLEKTGGYDETLPVNEDWDIWLRVARHCQFAFTNRVVAKYRYHDGNITQITSPHFTEHINGRGKVLDKIFNEPDLPPNIIAMRPLAYQNLHLSAARSWLTCRKFSDAFCSFLQAVSVGRRPLRTIIWISWLILVDEFLMRFSLGRHLANYLAGIADKWRNTRVLSASGSENK